MSTSTPSQGLAPASRPDQNVRYHRPVAAIATVLLALASVAGVALILNDRANPDAWLAGVQTVIGVAALLVFLLPLAALVIWWFRPRPWLWWVGVGAGTVLALAFVGTVVLGLLTP